MSLNPLRVDRCSTEFIILLTKEVEEIELPDKIQEAQLNQILINQEQYFSISMSQILHVFLFAHLAILTAYPLFYRESSFQHLLCVGRKWRNHRLFLLICWPPAQQVVEPAFMSKGTLGSSWCLSDFAGVGVIFCWKELRVTWRASSVRMQGHSGSMWPCEQVLPALLSVIYY